MGIDVKTLSLSKQYTKETVDGAGAIKGVPCQIKSITNIEGGKKITFLWEDNSGNEHESYMNVMDGSKGDIGETGAQGRGIKHSYVNQQNHFINKILSVVVGGNPLALAGGRSLVNCYTQTYVL